MSDRTQLIKNSEWLPIYCMLGSPKVTFWISVLFGTASSTLTLFNVRQEESADDHRQGLDHYQRSHLAMESLR